jgi:hypothetical protein
MTARAVKAISPVEIVGKGTRKSDHAPVYAATSASELGKFHLIAWTAQGWECECAAFVWRKRCSHVRALSARLAVELRQRDAAVAAAQIGPDDAFSITATGRAALAEWRARKEQEAQRDTAPRRGPQPFSLMRQ